MERSRVAQQLTYLVPGALLSWWLDTPRTLLALAVGSQGWAGIIAGASLLSGGLVVGLFLYILFYPMLKGVSQPNMHNFHQYRQWRKDRELSTVIPLLTGTMVIGWSLLWITFSQHTDLGVMEGFLGALGIYLAVFGTLGLIPVSSATSSHPE